MKLALVDWIVILLPLVFAEITRRASSAPLARRWAVLGAGLVTALSVAIAIQGAGRGATADQVALGIEGERWRALAPLFVSAIGTFSMAMTPARCARAATFARTLLVLSTSLGLVLSRTPMAGALFVALGTLPVILELRSTPETAPLSRSFSAYLVPSALAIFAAAALEESGLGRIAFAFYLLGFAIRTATVPFHSWLPRFFDRAPVGMVVMFAMPQLGVYLHARAVSVGLDAGFQGLIASLAAVTAVFAAAMGAAQNRPRRALGYLLMSQTALVIMGIESSSRAGYVGALGSWFVSGLASSGLAMTLAALEARRGRITLDRPSGNFERAPLLAASYLVFGLAGVGAPLTFGFVAGDLLFEGTSHAYPVLAAMGILATAINAIHVARGFFGAFSGAPSGAKRDLTPRERVAVSFLVGALLVMGTWPAAILRYFDAEPPAPTSGVVDLELDASDVTALLVVGRDVGGPLHDVVGE